MRTEPRNIKACTNKSPSLPIGAGKADSLLHERWSSNRTCGRHAHLLRCYQIRFSPNGLNEADREAIPVWAVTVRKGGAAAAPRLDWCSNEMKANR
jgi:hypothetical protein